MEIINNWNGFKQIIFDFEDREAILVFPKDEDKTDKWLFKTEYFNAFPAFEIEMIKRGWHLAYVANKTRWCLDEDLELKKRFADFLIKEYGLHEKCVPVGMSCGGLIGTKFAAKYPQYVSCMYIDAPVLNLLSCPAALGQGTSENLPEFIEATGMTLSELICYREHPIDMMKPLVENDIRIVLVYGTEDTEVPYSENGAILEKYYREHNGEILVISKTGCGHHPHGLDDSTPIIDFVLRNS